MLSLVLQELFSSPETERRWRSVVVRFGAAHWSAVTCWSSMRRRVKTCVIRSTQFYWITISGTMPGITGKIWKIFRFTEYGAYITKSSRIATVLLCFLFNYSSFFRTVIYHVLVWNLLNQTLSDDIWIICLISLSHMLIEVGVNNIKLLENL